MSFTANTQETILIPGVGTINSRVREQRTVSLPSPPTGQTIPPIVVPDGEVWNIAAFKFRLVTDATAATRVAVLAIGIISYVAVTQSANQFFTYNARRNFSYISGSLSSQFYYGLDSYYLPPGNDIKINVSGIQPGDALDNIAYVADVYKVE